MLTQVASTDASNRPGLDWGNFLHLFVLNKQDHTTLVQCLITTIFKVILDIFFLNLGHQFKMFENQS